MRNQCRICGAVSEFLDQNDNVHILDSALEEAATIVERKWFLGFTERLRREVAAEIRALKSTAQKPAEAKK